MRVIRAALSIPMVLSCLLLLDLVNAETFRRHAVSHQLRGRCEGGPAATHSAGRARTALEPLIVRGCTMGVIARVRARVVT